MPSESNHDCVFSDDELRQFAPAPRVDKREKKKARQQERNGGGDKAGGATFQVWVGDNDGVALLVTVLNPSLDRVHPFAIHHLSLL